MVKIVWREWFNEHAVRQLTEMGTLPRYETNLNWEPRDITRAGGEEVAAIVADLAFVESSGEMFKDGGKMVIIEPDSISGAYEIDVSYAPSFEAFKSSDDE